MKVLPECKVRPAPSSNSTGARGSTPIELESRNGNPTHYIPAAGCARRGAALPGTGDNVKVAINKSRVDKLACPDGKSQTFLWDSLLPGFGVRCTKSGFKSYVVQRTMDGKEVRRTVGPHGEYTVDEAREEARHVLQGMRKGVDPIDARKSRQAEQQRQDALALTLRDVVTDYIAHKQLAPRTRVDTLLILDRAFADWADRPAREITRVMCERRFDELAKRGKSSASLAFVLLRAWLNRARDMHVSDEGDYQILQVNPVKLMQNTRTLHKGTARTTRIPADKLAAVWAAIQERRNPDRYTPSDVTSADIVVMMLLTGLRIGETLRIEWDHVDLEGNVPSLHIPVNKTNKPVTLPLSTQLVQMLTTRKRRRGNPFVFPARDPGSKGHAGEPRSAWGDVDTPGYVSRAAGLHLSNHDMRRTYTSAGQACGIELWRVEALTVHSPKSITLQSYTELSNLRYLAPEQQRISDYLTGAVPADAAPQAMGK
jgi:integrase